MRAVEGFDQVRFIILYDSVARDRFVLDPDKRKEAFLRTNRTRRSMSLAAPADPHAEESKIAIHSASFRVSIETMVSRAVLGRRIGLSDTHLRYTVLMEKNGEGGYTVTLPSLPGCISEGVTREEAPAQIEEAIRGVYQSSPEARQAHSGRSIRPPQDRSSRGPSGRT